MTADLRRTMLDAIARGGGNVAARLAEQHGVSRQSASAWLAKLKREGIITSSGVGRTEGPVKGPRRGPVGDDTALVSAHAPTARTDNLLNCNHGRSH